MYNFKAINTYLLLSFILTFSSFSAFAQKYKSVADTARLNQEYAKDQKDLSDLKAKLDKANSKTDEYQSKVTSTSKDATDATEASKSQAATATNGYMGDVKKEEKLAKKARTKADDARDARIHGKNNQKEIKRLNNDIEKKQKRLDELNAMRSSINNMSQAKPDSNHTAGSK